MKISNPYFRQAQASAQDMTVESSNVNASSKAGIIYKTLFLIIATIAAGAIVAGILYNTLVNKDYTDEQKASVLGQLSVWLFISLGAMLISGFVTAFFPGSARVMGPVYAVSVGSLLGTMCMFGELYVRGITLMAGGGTAVIFLITLGAYAAGLKKKLGAIATFGLVLIVSLLICELMLFIFFRFNKVNANIGVPILLAIEAVYLIYGCVCLLMNFGEAESIVAAGFDKKYEWSVALGLLSSIVLIFIELFRIILIIASSSKKD